MAINIVKGLPIDAKKLFLKAYKKAFNKYGNEKTAYNIAISIIKKKYTKKENKWILKSSVSVNSNIKKSGFLFNPNYTFTAVLSSNNKDYDGNSVSDYLLRYFDNTGKVHDNGDFDHLKFDGLGNYKGVFKRIKHWYDDGKLYLKFLIDKTHNKFEEVKDIFKDKKISELSAEFYNPVVKNGKIMFASDLGWSVCKDDTARNSDSKIIKAE